MSEPAARQQRSIGKLDWGLLGIGMAFEATAVVLLLAAIRAI